MLGCFFFFLWLYQLPYLRILHRYICGWMEEGHCIPVFELNLPEGLFCSRCRSPPHHCVYKLSQEASWTRKSWIQLAFSCIDARKCLKTLDCNIIQMDVLIRMTLHIFQYHYFHWNNDEMIWFLPVKIPVQYFFSICFISMIHTILA